MAANSLIHQQSPYLLQHANNPVKWVAWSKEALECARKEDKMILVSIGYSTCHWCHVMAHESFENKEVAALMNANFVCIKVDREERPDVDQLYMEAVQLLTGAGGWPLNCFALPDGSPVFGGTYFSKKDWLEVLKYMAGIYKDERERAHLQAAQLKEGIAKHGFYAGSGEGSEVSSELIKSIFMQMHKSFDRKQGGFSGAPKFPSTVCWAFVLRYYFYTGDILAADQVKRTLNKMFCGGIYDHLEGGFSRYTVDSHWKIPHFEKMLYDNAQLLSLYSEAFLCFGISDYKKTIDETAQFLMANMASKNGGLYAAIDADSEDGEGAYYVWTKEEIEANTSHPEFLCEYFNCTAEGNWEHGKNILFVTQNLPTVAAKYHLTTQQGDHILAESLERLRRKRQQRPELHKDTKVLTSWNALAAVGFCDAYRATGNQQYLNFAVAIMEALLKTQLEATLELKRVTIGNKSSVNGFLDDYAVLIKSLMHLYQHTFDGRYLSLSEKLCEYVLKEFSDSEENALYYTSISNHELVIRQKEFTDDVIPSSNALMAENLLNLGNYTGKVKYTAKAKAMVTEILPQLQKHGRYYSHWCSVVLQLVYPQHQLVISAPDPVVAKISFDRHFTPNVLYSVRGEDVLTFSKKPETPVTAKYYLCTNRACELPDDNPDVIISKITEHRFGRAPQ